MKIDEKEMKLDLLPGSFISIISNRTILPRKMLLFNILSWQLILVLVPDIHQILSPNITTMDYVMSRSSGNPAAVIMFVSQFIWLTRNEKKFEQNFGVKIYFVPQ